MFNIYLAYNSYGRIGGIVGKMILRRGFFLFVFNIANLVK
jgi:hypothetical protein